ncbi:hypothetical protein SAMN05518669_11010 [Variovorax sp. YR634]|uniref:hypothetical protein n=1 Tax=Variovorax sp. YR634 TaxID=1884385 RepID=UPI00089A8EB5|nr:hypothetical protein [Variovorax sp. YR634]SDY18717.1 hypothetical protein SAMN05518669_11010 [Variovorax sp. YR634]
MSRRPYRRRRRDSLFSAVDDTAHIAARFGPVGALWTGVIGFAVFYAALPACMIAWTADRKATLKGPAAAAFANLLDQVMWHRFISPCQWAGVAILLVCSAIAIWKHLGQADLDGDDVTFLSAVSKAVSRLIGH